MALIKEDVVDAFKRARLLKPSPGVGEYNIQHSHDFTVQKMPSFRIGKGERANDQRRSVNMPGPDKYDFFGDDTRK